MNPGVLGFWGDGIARTVRAWRAQTHSNFELLLLDDESTDGTHAAALAAAGGDVRVRVLAEIGRAHV